MTQKQKPSSGNNQQEQIDTEISSEETSNIYPDLTLEEIKAIAPINSKGSPDLYNHMPTRMIPQEEAKYRKWGYFFQSTPCRYGHVAPRYTSNHRLCVDCLRLKSGKTTIGEKTGIRNSSFPGKGGKFGKGVTVKIEKQQQVDAWEKRFLEAFAYHKDFKAACQAVNVTEAQIDARLAHSDIFKKAYDLLQDRINEKKLKDPEVFVWTKEKHDKLIEVFINTGELATARDSIGVTPFEYFQELSRNPIFAERVKEAEPLAHLALEERAIQLALAGNDKLLTKILSVKKPEYKDNIKVDMNVTEKLSDKQLNSKLSYLLNKLGIAPITVEVREIDDSGTNAAPRAIGRSGSEEESEENRPAIQHTGS
jgi:hypothetical protein